MMRTQLVDLLFPLATIMPFLPTFQLFSIIASWGVSSGTALSTLCICFPGLLSLHRILFDVYSSVYHLLPKTSRDLPVLFTTEPQTVPFTYISRHSRNTWSMNEQNKGLPQQQRRPPAIWLDHRVDTLLPNDFSLSQEDGLGWAVGQRETANRGPNWVISGGW